ncbi:hypothetical protein EJF36_17490 [Bacillus sp. HMF5848]|uniref:hypothetical protein n=1 Tax=Bacillus sp. HMF5848 TaxID=2495421 RepID=UPI000F78201E|nr:hypothetical protein [Bacillus sp. HMF5848]RSK28516.1 hypothetical protein EJF36_17490 [Bacillus sp. HMF5848]
MNREEFLTMTPTKRVEAVNGWLKEYTLKEIAVALGYPYSTFTTEMRNGGEYQYNKKNKQYVKVQPTNAKLEDDNMIRFLKDHYPTLKQLIERFQSNQLLILDEKVYSNQAKFESKSIKMNNEIYELFSNFCKENYPHFRIQDLVAQALLDFKIKYKVQK